MTPDAREQIKADCEHDEASARQECFFDTNRGTIVVDNIWYCEQHGRCRRCERSLAGQKPLYCVCDDYGAGHEDWAWCSDACLDESHPEPPDYEEEEEEE